MAHLGYFERTYVRERRWLSGAHYGALVALCQILPGPTSSQVGFLIGLHRAGWPGALAAWFGFTLPSALLMYAAAVLAARPEPALAAAVVHGLKLVAVAVVAQAVMTMAYRACTDRVTDVIAASAAALLLLAGSTAAQLGAMLAAAAAGMLWCRPVAAIGARSATALSGTHAGAAFALFLLLLLGLPLLSWHFSSGPIALAHVFYRSGALVFGGGHVVLPLLREALVPRGLLSDDGFLAGYGLAQAMPGPLFSVAAYLGAVATHGSASGAAVALLAIFLPGLLLAVAGVSLWGRLADHPRAGAALTGVNAAVVGILAAALYNPVWVSAVRDAGDVAVAAAGLILLQAVRAAPLIVVVLCVACSALRALY